MVAYAVLLGQVPNPSPLVVAVSLGYVVYYVAISLYLTVLRRRRVLVAA